MIFSLINKINLLVIKVDRLNPIKFQIYFIQIALKNKF